jgi:hypothetical protein
LISPTGPRGRPCPEAEPCPEAAPAPRPIPKAVLALKPGPEAVPAPLPCPPLQIPGAADSGPGAGSAGGRFKRIPS